MCCGLYIVIVNGKLAKNATMDPVLFFLCVLQQKKTSPLAVLSLAYLRKQKRIRWHRISMHFSASKRILIDKSFNLRVISAMFTTKRQSYKKVTCPFKYRVILSFIEIVDK